MTDAVKVEALRRFRYAKRDVQVGDVLEMPTRDARLMVAVRNVRAAAAAAPGTYQRRDMRAEEQALVIPTFAARPGQLPVKRGPGRPPKVQPQPLPAPAAPAPAPSQPLGTSAAPGLVDDAERG